MKAFILILVSFLIATIIGQTCNIANTKDNGATDYESCQEYTTSSTSKLCCYVKGKDKNENSISACQELTGTEKGALKDLDSAEKLYDYLNTYYLSADCNLGKEISLCDPDDKKSETPLSAEYCSKYKVVWPLGVDDDSKCCYVSGVSVGGENVYSCVGIDDYFNDKEEMKEEIEEGDFKRLGALNNVKIVCNSGDSEDFANFYSISLVSFIFALLFI